MIRWTTAFLDLPADGHAAGVAFWSAVTGTVLSPPRGPDGRFARLLPPGGDAFLRVQRTAEGPRVHVDLHVDDVAAAEQRAVGLGARVLHREGHVVLASPGGFVHCLVPDEGHAVRPGPVGAGPGAGSLVDQVCLDVPHGGLEPELAYWAALTGWRAHARPWAATPELSVLERGAGLPLRLLVQELGPQDAGERVRAHLDVACGQDVTAHAARHVALGARVEAVREHWTTLLAPGGLRYCLTSRDPAGDRPVR